MMCHWPRPYMWTIGTGVTVWEGRAPNVWASCFLLNRKSNTDWVPPWIICPLWLGRLQEGPATFSPFGVDALGVYLAPCLIHPYQQWRRKIMPTPGRFEGMPTEIIPIPTNVWHIQWEMPGTIHGTTSRLAFLVNMIILAGAPAEPANRLSLYRRHASEKVGREAAGIHSARKMCIAHCHKADYSREHTQAGLRSTWRWKAFSLLIPRDKPFIKVIKGCQSLNGTRSRTKISCGTGLLQFLWLCHNTSPSADALNISLSPWEDGSPVLRLQHAELLLSEQLLRFVLAFWDVMSELFAYLSDVLRSLCGVLCYAATQAWHSSELMTIVHPDGLYQ